MGKRLTRARQECCVSGIGVFVFFLFGSDIWSTGAAFQGLGSTFLHEEAQAEEGALSPVLLPDSFREELGESVQYLYQDENVDIILVSHDGSPPQIPAEARELFYPPRIRRHG